MTLSERRQVQIAIVQAVTAALALGISVYTFAQQVGLNRAQQVLNTYARQRDERKYSSRVAIWAVAGGSASSVLPPGLDLSIQNRSPVPVRNVHVVGHLQSGQTGDVVLIDIPPCTIERHRIAPPPHDPFVKGTDRFAGYSGLSLRFTVDGRRWELTSEGLSELKHPETDRTARLRSIRIDIVDKRPGDSSTTDVQDAEVQDCGEGG